MIQKLLDKIPYVRKLKEENKEIREKHDNLLKAYINLKKENRDYVRTIGFLLNEPHVVREDKSGRYVPLDPRTLEKYQDVEIKKVQVPPWNHVKIYAVTEKTDQK